MTEYKLVYSNRKSLSIEVNKNLEVIVRSPFFVSKKQIERFVSEREKWIESARQKIINRPKNTDINLSDEMIKKSKQKAKEILPNKVEYYSGLMDLYPTSIKITSAKTRFGSCSYKNSICFSYRLMLYPDDAIDYVVVHELAHIKYKNHSKNFYKLIEKYMPDYRERQKLLKTIQEISEK